MNEDKKSLEGMDLKRNQESIGNKEEKLKILEQFIY